MKALKMVLIACSLSAAAAMAHAQTSTPAAGAQQFAQNQEQFHEQPAASAVQRRRFAAPAKRAEECVGPVSFCNVFFGS
jgi:predicted aconitase